MPGCKRRTSIAGLHVEMNMAADRACTATYISSATRQVTSCTVMLVLHGKVRLQLRVLHDLVPQPQGLQLAKNIESVVR